MAGVEPRHALDLPSFALCRYIIHPPPPPLYGLQDRIHSFHAKIELPPPPPLGQTQAPMSLKTPPSPHRLFDLQGSLDKRMHFFHSRQILSPSETGYIFSAHRLTSITLLTPIAKL